MDRTYDLVDAWGALLLRVGTGGYTETWFLSAPFVLGAAWLFLRGALRLRREGRRLGWSIDSRADLLRVRAAINDHVRHNALYALTLGACLAFLAVCSAVLELRFHVALSHVLAVALLPGPAIVYGRTFLARFRRLPLRVDDADAAALYEDWVTQWQHPRWSLKPRLEDTAGALSVPSARGHLSDPR